VGDAWFRYRPPPVPVRFLARPNRFLAIVEPAAGGARFEAHVPNPGRMEELLVPGDTLGFAVRCAVPGRRTSWDLICVRHGPTLVSIDTRVANRVVERALRIGAISWARGRGWRSEQRWGPHRFDFARYDERTGQMRSLLEVKSSNLRVGRTAYFPDAPTERGRRHLEALAAASRRGLRADVLFAIQRSDVRAFRANRHLDPEFGKALDRARRAGVGLHAVRLRVLRDAVTLGPPVPVL
jgi:sugar fermentation stimulation protein